MITVSLVTNSGDGRPQLIDVANGVCLEAFLDMHFDGNVDDFDVTVRRTGESHSQSVDSPEEFTLQNGDRVTLSPTKVEGATI